MPDTPDVPGQPQLVEPGAELGSPEGGMSELGGGGAPEQSPAGVTDKTTEHINRRVLVQPPVNRRMLG